MTAAEIVMRRLAHQHLIGPPLTSPEAAVAHFGAVQAQDYQGAKWAVAQRCGATDADVEAAFDAGRILRTHLCRPTWHFVAAPDIRWLLMLTGPRVQRQNAGMYRKLLLDEKLLRRTDALLVRALEGGKHLDRSTLAGGLRRSRVDLSDMRFVHMLMHAELEGLICSGPRQGKQFTYALLEERVPATPALSRDEALAELARRYFTSRGPASLNDFALWSGLTTADGRRGVALAGDALSEVRIDDRPHWYPSTSVLHQGKKGTVHLVPNYDEYGIGYKDRSAFYDPEQGRQAREAGIVPFRHLLIVDGRMRGTWDRKLTKDTVYVHIAPFGKLGASVHRAIEQAAKAYARSLGLRAVVTR